MQKFFLAVDRFNTRIGHLFAWLIVVLTGLICWEVFARYVLNSPNPWAFDAQMMLYGTLFMFAGAYTLAAASHVRGDILYGFLKPRTQAIFDLTLYLLFFVPGVVAMVWAGWQYFGESLAIRERSSITASGPPIYPFKAVIPATGALLLLQGVVEIMRCIVCIRTGAWPARLGDVEEVDVDKLRAMVERDAPEGASRLPVTASGKMSGGGLVSSAGEHSAGGEDTGPGGHADDLAHGVPGRGSSRHDATRRGS